MKKGFFVLGLLLLSFISNAQQVVSIGSNKSSKGSLQFLLGGALEFGGESIGEVSFQDGSVQKMYAGQGGTFMAGGSYTFGKNENFELRATLGYKYLTTKATNVSISLNRIPFRLTTLWKPIPKLYVGAGFATHLGVKFNGGGLTPSENLGTATGPTFEVGYNVFSLALTPMNYKDRYGIKYDATAIGLYFVAPLRKRYR